MNEKCDRGVTEVYHEPGGIAHCSPVIAIRVWHYSRFVYRRLLADVSCEHPAETALLGLGLIVTLRFSKHPKQKVNYTTTTTILLHVLLLVYIILGKITY